jgi:hypothetical protein
MKNLRNQDGIALLTALMFTFICLTMILGLLYMVTRGIQASASNKVYKTAREASYGGADIALKEVIPQIFQGYTSSQLTDPFSTVKLQLPTSSTCLQEKLRLPTDQWSSACSKELDPKSSPDMTMQLKATGGNSQPYSVYTKIVDTVHGNTDTSGLQLEGSGVAEGSSTITPQHFPYVYRVEVVAEKSTAAKEKGSLSVQYAY